MLDETAFNTQTNGSSSYASAGAPSTPQVSWLRKTEYISREGSSRSHVVHDLCVFKMLALISSTINYLFAELVSKSRLLTSPAKVRFGTSKRPSRQAEMTSTSPRSGIPTSRMSPPSSPTRSCLTSKSGRMNTICSDSRSGLERGLLMYVRASSRLVLLWIQN